MACRRTSGSCWSSATAARTPVTRPGSSRHPRNGYAFDGSSTPCSTARASRTTWSGWSTGCTSDTSARAGFRRARRKDQIQREKDRILGELLAEFVIAPKARPPGADGPRQGSLRRAGRGAGGRRFQRLCAEHQLRPDVAAHGTRLILDEMRQRMAVNHEVLKTRLFPNDKLASRFGIQVNRYVGKPVAFLPPQQKSSDTRSYKLFSTWNTKGNPTSDPAALAAPAQASTTRSATAPLPHSKPCWSGSAEDGYLLWETVGSEHESGEGLPGQPSSSSSSRSAAPSAAARSATGSPRTSGTSTPATARTARAGCSPGRGRSQRRT